MLDTENYYVALDENGVATDLVLAEGNYLALQADMPERFANTTFEKIDHATPDLAPNQIKNFTGWSQKEDGSISCDWDVVTLSQKDCHDLWIRRERDQRLFVSDWTQGADSPLSDEDKAAWATYRQALRDMTTTYADVSDPADITWPLYPGEPAYTEPEEESEEAESESEE